MLLSSQGRRISGDNASILGDLCRYDKNAQLSSNERPFAKGVSQEWREDKQNLERSIALKGLQDSAQGFNWVSTWFQPWKAFN